MEFKQEGIISSVKRHSLAEEAEIRPGEHLCAINGQPVRDLLDVSFAAADTEVVLTIRGIDGALRDVKVEKGSTKIWACPLSRQSLIGSASVTTIASSVLSIA